VDVPKRTLLDNCNEENVKGGSPDARLVYRVSGWLYEDGRFREGSLTVEDGIVVSVRRQKASDAVATGPTPPAFANAHTPAGDAAGRAACGSWRPPPLAAPSVRSCSDVRRT